MPNAMFIRASERDLFSPKISKIFNKSDWKKKIPQKVWKSQNKFLLDKLISLPENDFFTQ